jgi:hypothetical protein
MSELNCPEGPYQKQSFMPKTILQKKITNAKNVSLHAEVYPEFPDQLIGLGGWFVFSI